MMAMQNAFKVFVCGRPHPGSMVVSASSYLNSIFVAPALIQVLCLIILANAYLNCRFGTFLVLEQYASTSHV